jgi:hypothetical protein
MGSTENEGLSKKATNILSWSIADAIKFCGDTLHLPQFQGSEANEEFIS